MKADTALLYRLLRALASIGLLRETASRAFTVTAAGALLRADHPHSMKAMTRLEEGPQHYALWKHLPAMIRDGEPNAFKREFHRMAFDHAKVDADYDVRFKQAMWQRMARLDVALQRSAARRTASAAASPTVGIGDGAGDGNGVEGSSCDDPELSEPCLGSRSEQQIA